MSEQPEFPTVLARVDSVTFAVTGSGAWTTTPVIGEPSATAADILRQLRRDVRDNGKK